METFDLAQYFFEFELEMKPKAEQKALRVMKVLSAGQIQEVE